MNIIMNLKHIKILFYILSSSQLLLAVPVMASGWPPPQSLTNNLLLPYSFTNSRTILLRNNRLESPQVIEVGAEINIDRKFLLEHLGTDKPSQEQIQKLMLNPGEISNGKSENKIVTERFIDFSNKKVKNDYFFPVTIKTKSGEFKTGKMALQAYVRKGLAEIKRKDGADPRHYQSPEITREMQTLIEQNKDITEAQICTSCSTKIINQMQDISNITKAIETNLQTSSNVLWHKYKDFAREFSTIHRNISKANAGYYKRLFVKSLVERMGEKDAGVILAALTGFAEAPYRSSSPTQIAEIAAILKVIDNRANNNFRTKSRTLRDIGRSGNTDSRLAAVLADYQFSVWNDKDNSLTRILSFNPEAADNLTKRKMALTFEAQAMIQTGKIEFLGKMNDTRLQHYHANYVNPYWSRVNKKLNAPTIKVDGFEVDLSKQKGARHVFYAGIS